MSGRLNYNYYYYYGTDEYTIFFLQSLRDQILVRFQEIQTASNIKMTSAVFEPVRDAMIKRIVNVIHGFHCHVWGEYVVDGVINEQYSNVSTLNCIFFQVGIPTTYADLLVSNLSIDYDVKESITSCSWRKDFVVVSANSGIVALRVYESFKDIVMFDIDSIRLSRSNLYVTASGSPPKLLSIMDRARKRRFSLLPDPRDQTTNAHADAMAVAEARVASNASWIMDGSVESPWIVNRWSVFSMLPYVPRQHVDTSKFDQCPICCEHFVGDDIVVNLRCNHNFHLACSKPDRKSGISAWLAQDRSTCPCCRAEIF